MDPRRLFRVLLLAAAASTVMLGLVLFAPPPGEALAQGEPQDAATFQDPGAAEAPVDILDAAAPAPVAPPTASVPPAAGGSVADFADELVRQAQANASAPLPLKAGVPLEPWMLIVLVAGLTAAITELLKGGWKWFNGLPAMAKAGAATLIGTAMGAFAAATPLPWEWWLSVLCGFGGGGGFTLVRTIGLFGQSKQDGSGGTGSAAIVGMLLAGLMLVSPGCRTVTPAIRAGGAFLMDGYGRYVKTDPILSQQQRSERLEVVCNHNRLLGNDVPVWCPVTVSYCDDDQDGHRSQVRATPGQSHVGCAAEPGDDCNDGDPTIWAACPPAPGVQ